MKIATMFLYIFLILGAALSLTMLLKENHACSQSGGIFIRTFIWMKCIHVNSISTKI